MAKAIGIDLGTTNYALPSSFKQHKVSGNVITAQHRG